MNVVHVTFQCMHCSVEHWDPKVAAVDFSVAPILESANTVVQQAVGYVKELVCDIRGYPTPKEGDITWTKRGSGLGFDSQ